MNATKRKFNALINGIGNKSTTNVATNVTTAPKEATGASKGGLTTTTAEADAQAKKRRTEIPSSSSQLPSFSELRKEQTMKHKKSASVAVAPTSAETPKYAPWDRAEFLKRLKSFTNLTDWTAKPARVNEVEWAKRGWVCQKSERVRCCLCNVEILVKLNTKDVDGKEVPVYVAGNIGMGFGSRAALGKEADNGLEEAMVERYAEMIVTSHEENCLWRKRGCDGEFYL
jgi:C3HC zinc finger-like